MAPPNLAQYRLPASTALEGKTYTLSFADNATLSLRFGEAATATWAWQGDGWQGTAHERCDIVEVADEAWFIDIGLESRPLEALTVVLSVKTGWALIVHQRREPTEEHAYGPAVVHTFHPARIAELSQVGPAPHETRELLGRWHLFRYSDENLYEHIYVSSTKMCSHNLDTQNTRGRADCHDTSYYKVSDGLYVIAWREHYSQAAMVFAENLNTWTTTGKVLHPAGPDFCVSVGIGGKIMPVDVRFPDTETITRP